MESGWGFNFKREIKYSIPPVPAGDTVIDNVLHKEFRYTYEGAPRNMHTRCFFRCDLSQGPFNFDPELSKQFGCPITTAFFMDSTFTNIYSVVKASFIANTLTPEENKVFDAWVKFAKANPF